MHVVMFSGGIGSWATAKLVAQDHGTRNLTLLFADTKMEDEDTYRFLGAGAANIGAKLVVLADGRDIYSRSVPRRQISRQHPHRPLQPDPEARTDAQMGRRKLRPRRHHRLCRD